MFTFGSLLISPKIWSAIWSLMVPQFMWLLIIMLSIHCWPCWGVPHFWTSPRKTLYWSHIEIFSPHQPFLPTKHLPLWLLPLNITGAHLCAPLDLAQVNLESQCTYKIASWLPVFVRLASLKTRQVPKLEIFVCPPIAEESFHNGVLTACDSPVYHSLSIGSPAVIPVHAS